MVVSSLLENMLFCPVFSVIMIALSVHVDDSEDGSDIEPSENNEEGDSFMGAYSNALSEELKTSTLNKSFVRASESFKINEVSSLTFPLRSFHGGPKST